MQFVSLATTGRLSVSQLCEDFDISRKTGHKWLNRYARQGAKGLAELSRRPQGCSHQSAEAVVALIIKERKIHPTWGPKKLYEILRCKHGLEAPPGAQHDCLNPASPWVDQTPQAQAGTLPAIAQ